MAARSSVSVRMYHVGFGDAFLVTVRRGRRTWRMLVDCGVHSQGTARPIREVVSAIIADLAEVTPAGRPPHLDVVVATHRHADHISGFGVDQWAEVSVDEVWLPYLEDPDDDEARATRSAQMAAAREVQRLALALGGPDRSTWPPGLALADALALNSLSNAQSMDRLLGRGSGFRTPATVRFLPRGDEPRTTLPTGLPDTVVHVLGPPRDPELLRRMDPPSAVAWLRLAGATAQLRGDGLPLFDPAYHVADGSVPAALAAVAPSLRLDELADEIDEVVNAAAGIEHSVNNSSLFLVLDVAGTRLVFPGDAQYGAWQHVLGDPESRALVAHPAFYKIGHHGSHNATPREYVESDLGEGAYAMLPWGMVKRWADSIPKAELIDALAEHHTRVIRTDEVLEDPRVEVNGTLWSEVTLTVG